jgi:hypothetical protein
MREIIEAITYRDFGPRADAQAGQLALDQGLEDTAQALTAELAIAIRGLSL